MNELSRSRGSERYEACLDDGAGRRTRTPDLLITNQLLYQLSYTSISNEHDYYNEEVRFCQELFRKIFSFISASGNPDHQARKSSR